MPTAQHILDADAVNRKLDRMELSNRCVVLVDDVLNSGATLIYGVQHLLQAPLKRLTTAVLVDRNHKSFPIKADIKGLSLSTSLKDHVDVHFHDTGAITVSLRD